MNKIFNYRLFVFIIVFLVVLEISPSHVTATTNEHTYSIHEWSSINTNLFFAYEFAFYGIHSINLNTFQGNTTLTLNTFLSKTIKEVLIQPCSIIYTYYDNNGVVLSTNEVFLTTAPQLFYGNGSKEQYQYSLTTIPSRSYVVTVSILGNVALYFINGTSHEYTNILILPGHVSAMIEQNVVFVSSLHTSVLYILLSIIIIFLGCTLNIISPKTRGILFLFAFGLSLFISSLAPFFLLYPQPTTLQYHSKIVYINQEPEYSYYLQGSNLTLNFQFQSKIVLDQPYTNTVFHGIYGLSFSGTNIVGLMITPSDPSTRNNLFLDYSSVSDWINYANTTTNINESLKIPFQGIIASPYPLNSTQIYPSLYIGITFRNNNTVTSIIISHLPTFEVPVRELGTYQSSEFIIFTIVFTTVMFSEKLKLPFRNYFRGSDT